MGACAKIEQSNLTHLPTMGKGNINTALLWDWFNKAEQFFRHKSIEVSTHVEAIAWGMTSIHATLTAGSVPPCPAGYVFHFLNAPGAASAAVTAIISEVPGDTPTANLINISDDASMPTIATVLLNTSSWVDSGD
ncbi:hypothetical protein BDN71DRAFT_1505680 [Pleurotus eryngii]|uniref:Uncharacterized protein n=1 Tax=Pleurotus eryngii TaxID=5323 RepID=A0A9P5ZYF1_PLEER|nr:hypothetical protein BDN71DRAFT_1505680 [Pleurotus eryngii]